MGIVPADLLVKSAIEAALAHLRANQWLLDDVWGELATDALSSTEYGWKDVDAAKKWFNGNNIRVVFPFRVDKPTFPCITVVNMSTGEEPEKASLGDEGEEEGNFDPKANAILPQLVYRPFTPKAYDRSTGIVTLPNSLETNYMVPGQFYVSASSQKAYQILEVLGADQFRIKENTSDNFTGGYIVPPSNLWNVKRERTRIGESFTLGLHAQSDPSQCIWLRMLVSYILLRYKEAYFESRGFELSTFTVSEVDLNPQYQQVDRVFSCYVTLRAEVETQWIKYVAPKLYSTQVNIRIIDGPKTPEGYLKQVQKQGWMMPPDPPLPPAENQSGIDEDGNGFTVQQGIDEIDGGEDDQG